MLDIGALRLDHAGAQDLVVGQRVIGKEGEFMCVARIGAFQQHGLRLGAPDDIGNLAQRHVAVVRAGVVAPAQVHAQLLGGDVLERMVERGDVHADALAELFGRKVGELHMAAHGKIGAVDLQGDTGRRDGLVFVAQALGEGEDIFLVAGVELVGEEQRGHAGAGGGHEGGVAIGEADETLGIDPGRFHVDHSDGRGAGGGRALGAALVAEHLRLGPGEGLKVGEFILPRFAAEARQPVLDIGGVGGLGLLAVVDDRDARLDLALDDIGRGLFHRRVEVGLRHRLAALAREDQIEQGFGARQAADMGGGKARGHLQAFG